MMTEWIWTGSLAAFARIVKLRSHVDAQKECQEIAQLISDEITKTDLLKISWKVLTEENN
jgi:thymidylate synthase (FAD)